jgi:4-hydroxy-3-polyprenylbenzoate decarboxylase
MAFRDLREWMVTLEGEGELARVKTKVDWNLEIGGITQEVFDKEGPALLFENIKDYDNTLCRKLFTGSLATYPRVALMLGLPKNTPYKDLIRIWRERSKKRVKPVIVSKGPVKENIVKGDDVNLLQFPVPLWHDRDGGRYIGTFDGVITKHHDTDWMNVGLYRRMIHDRNKAGITFPIGQHAWQHWRTWRKKGKNLPVACAIGWDPILPAVASSYVPPNVSEYEVMGALRGEPVELVKCETSDLLVPATAEIVLEGEALTDLDSFTMEGPFGEYTGYYGTIPSKRPVFLVKCITFRNDPILQGTLEGVPINEDHRICSVHHSASVWDLLEERMVGITGVNVDPSTGWTNVFVQIDNSYVGQVFQVAANIWSAGISNMVGKNVFVFDTDVDIYDLKKIMWAFAYRVSPSRDIVEFPGWISPLDPVVHPKDKIHEAVNRGNRLLIDATKPLDWPRTDKWFGERFAPVAYPDLGTMEKVRSKWESYGIKV